MLRPTICAALAFALCVHSGSVAATEQSTGEDSDPRSNQFHPDNFKNAESGAPESSWWPTFSFGSYAQCILSKMPGVANDIAAAQIARGCLREYPGGFSASPKANAFFGGYAHGGECIADKAKNTSSPAAARLIAAACLRRYGPVD